MGQSNSERGGFQSRMPQRDIHAFFPTAPFSLDRRERLLEANTCAPPNAPHFCVDGRNGEEPIGPYYQTLGGSYNFAVLQWILDPHSPQFATSANTTFDLMKEGGLNISIHTGHHRNKNKSDCGFEDNLKEIITILKRNKDIIWSQITKEMSGLTLLSGQWEAIMKLVEKANLDTIPPGNELLSLAKKKGAKVQELKGDHQEQAVQVNLSPFETLDVDENPVPAFNLDLFYIGDVSEKLGMDSMQARLLSLGLFIATEIKLVEQKGKPKLPIIIHKR